VSLDALEETHDRERGVPGNFIRAIDTLHRLRRIRDTHEGFGFSTLTTVHGRNAGELEELERYIDEEIRPDNRGINLVRGKPFDPATLNVDLQPYLAAVERKRQAVTEKRLPLQSFPLSTLNGAKERVLYGEVARIARTGAFRSPCRAGQIGAVLYENGNVAACEILDHTIGNLRDFDLDFGRLWSSPRAEALRREIAERRCRCTWECALNTNVLFGPRYWPQLAREWVTGGRRSRVAVAAATAAAAAPVPRSVSVVIPCRDEMAVIGRKIRNSLGLAYPDPDQCEVLRLVSNRYEAGKAGAIRTGFEEARGEILLLTDADAIIERDALGRALVHFEDPQTGVVCGEQVYCGPLPADASDAPGDASNRRGGALMDPAGRRESIYDRVMRGIRKAESRLDSTFAVHGQMALFRRSLGLNPRAGVAADDVDLSLQARRKGYRIRYAEGARFWEERPRDPAAERRQMRRRGMSLAQVLWVNRDMLGRPRYGAFGLLQLPFQWAFLLLQPVCVALILTLGLALTVASMPAVGAVMIAAIAVLTAVSKDVRAYLLMNATMLSAIVLLLTGRAATDRWPRDRDAAPDHGVG
jgi:cellulose synthase/poly-beta-1,6-N-acetylglucosamine synthase-like glycosyltransferase